MNNSKDVKINDTTDNEGFVSVVDMFREQVKKNPDKIAVVSSTSSLTYKKLDELSDKVAASLLSAGVVPEDIIMIMLPRNVGVYVATLGILKTGAAYTIVNVQYPDDRVAYIYNDANCKYLISDKTSALDRNSLINDVLKKEPLLMETMLSKRSGTAELPKIDINPSWLCYLIYTSGSTGKPKGVMIEHGNLFNFVNPSPKNYEARGITEKGTVFLAMAQMTFDVSVMEEWLGLTSGMTVALASDEEIMNPLLMKDFMLKNKIDAVCFTPAYANTIFSIPQMQEALRAIKTYDIGSEAFPASLFTKIRAVNPHAYIMNGYGPTETTISCTMKVIESSENITIGKPNANVYAFIVDSDLRELPKGKIGELLICGKSVGRGYMNLPEETAKAFVTFKGMRAFKTGDLACINEADEIEFHGRADNQVKLRGLRIELDEIEKTIAEHSEVKQSAVKIFDNKILVGYYTLRNPGSGVTPENKNIREFIRQHLAHYMMPEVLIELPSMPVTENQKIDRNALPRPVLQESKILPPQNEKQKIILGILEDIFQDTLLGINTDFMNLGMSSLDIMLLSAELAKHFQVDVKFSDIIQNPTALALEKLIRSKSGSTETKKKDRCQCYEFLAIMGAAYAADKTSTLWNLPYLFSGEREKISIEQLKKAIVATLNAHPGIWMRFEMIDGKPFLIRNDDHPDYDLSVREVSDDEFETIRKKLIRPFFTGEPQLFRVELYVTPSKVHLFSDFSHIVMDAVSLDIFVKDIERGYRGEAIKPEAFSFLDLLKEQAQFVRSSEQKKVIQFYRNLFKKSPVKSSFPSDLHDEVPLVAWHKQNLGISTEAVRKICASLRVSESILFMALAAACVAHKGGNTAIYYPCAYNGRGDSRIQNTLGCFSVPFYVLTQWDENIKTGEYIQALQRQSVEHMRFEIQPMVELLAEFPELTTYGFIFQGEAAYEELMLGDARLTLQALGVEGAGGIYKLNTEIAIKDGQYHCAMEYRANELKESTVRELAHSLDTVLLHFDPEMKLADLLKVADAR
ncbi:MAG: amino acid adenylation domain-containing protein [Treponema sp.]|nr:amino acid adenylation domain-containing protein [Treponema sp.]